VTAHANVKGFIAGLHGNRRRVEAAAVRAVDEFGEHVIGDSQQLAPVDTGALQASATTLPAELDGTIVRKTLGHNTEYAAAVHERIDVHHELGQAKFLETAIRTNADKFRAFVADRIRRVMR